MPSILPEVADPKEMTIFKVTSAVPSGLSQSRLIEAGSLAKLRARLTAETWVLATASAKDVAAHMAAGGKVEPAK